MDHLTALRLFVRVALSGSFSRTAEETGMPRASVTAAIQAVENRVGTRLLNRTTRRVALTPDGEIYLERARRLLDEADEMDGLFRSGPDRLQGRLRVSLPERLALHVLIPALPDFLETHPALQMEFSVTDRFVDLVGAGMDCVIRAGSLHDSRLTGRRLGQLVQGTFASPAYLAAHGHPLTPDDLEGHCMVGYAAASGGLDFSWDQHKDGKTLSRPLAGSLAVDNAEAQIAAALAGLGLIQVPAYGLRRHVKAGTLVEILTDHRPAPLPLHVLYPHSRHRSRKVRAFLDWIQDTLDTAGVFEHSGRELV